MKAKVVEIELRSGESREFEMEARPWLGGRGLATKLFFDAINPVTEPLGPGNVIVFAVSPLTGTAAPTAGRAYIVFKSPLTGGLGSADFGGDWGKALKSAGIDALVIKGAAAKPAYLSVSDKGVTLSERVRLLDAADLWGKSVPEATAALAKRHGGESSALAIGPAGENLVRYATPVAGMNEPCGRGGPGAVMGAKNLKAVVASGSQQTPVAELDRMRAVVEQTLHIMKAAPITKRVLRDLGTAGLMHLINIMGMLPRRNFQTCSHEITRVDKVSGEALSRDILERPGACFGCPIRCRRVTRVREKRGEGPEYDALAMLGPLLDIYDLEAVALGNYAANELGIDAVSLGGTLAAAAELAGTGLLPDSGGLRPGFGDSAVYPEVVRMIAYREGTGDLLAEGSRRLAKRFSRPELAMTVKGMEIPAYDPRGMPAQALGYMTSPAGACHQRGGFSVALAYFGGIREVPRFSIRQASLTAMNQQNGGIVQDSLGVCRLTGYAAGLAHYARLYSAVTGEQTSAEDLGLSAMRIAALERVFNLKAGLTRKDDSLPERFEREPIIIDGRERVISASDRERMLSDYYHDCGWDRDGVPLRETLVRFGIDEKNLY